MTESIKIVLAYSGGLDTSVMIPGLRSIINKQKLSQWFVI